MSARNVGIVWLLVLLLIIPTYLFISEQVAQNLFWTGVGMSIASILFWRPKQH